MTVEVAMAHTPATMLTSCEREREEEERDGGGQGPVVVGGERDTYELFKQDKVDAKVDKWQAAAQEVGVEHREGGIWGREEERTSCAQKEGVTEDPQKFPRSPSRQFQPSSTDTLPFHLLNPLSRPFRPSAMAKLTSAPTAIQPAKGKKTTFPAPSSAAGSDDDQSAPSDNDDNLNGGSSHPSDDDDSASDEEEEDSDDDNAAPEEVSTSVGRKGLEESELARKEFEAA